MTDTKQMIRSDKKVQAIGLDDEEEICYLTIYVDKDIGRKHPIKVRRDYAIKVSKLISVALSNDDKTNELTIRVPDIVERKQTLEQSVATMTRVVRYMNLRKGKVLELQEDAKETFDKELHKVYTIESDKKTLDWMDQLWKHRMNCCDVIRQADYMDMGCLILLNVIKIALDIKQVATDKELDELMNYEITDGVVVPLRPEVAKRCAAKRKQLQEKYEKEQEEQEAKDLKALEDEIEAESKAEAEAKAKAEAE